MCPKNALALSGLANFRISGKSKLIRGSNLPGVADKPTNHKLTAVAAVWNLPSKANGWHDASRSI
jgi:hypothetical protein